MAVIVGDGVVEFPSAAQSRQVVELGDLSRTLRRAGFASASRDLVGLVQRQGLPLVRFDKGRQVVVRAGVRGRLCAYWKRDDGTDLLVATPTHALVERFQRAAARTSNTIAVRLQPETIAALEARAAAQDERLSAYVRRVLEFEAGRT